MLPGMGGFEAVVIALLALVIVGPKDLPVLMRRLARWVNKLRGMAAEFRMSFDELARQSELDELRREVEALRRGDPLTPVREHFDAAAADVNRGFDEHHGAYEAAVDEANGAAAAVEEPYLPSLEPAAAAAEALPPESALPTVSIGQAQDAPPEPSGKPARKRARRKSESVSAGGEA